MTVLHLGVVDQPYRTAGPALVGRKGKGRRRKRAQIGSRTTFDVARILEHRYGIMEKFFEVHVGDIDTAMADAMAGKIETLMMRGARGEQGSDDEPMKLTDTDLDKVKVAFDKFISEGEVERVGIAGTPTMAALHGVSHRFAHPYAKRGRRPSFVDTGLYLSSFRAWVD
jgi:hypothetical protein